MSGLQEKYTESVEKLSDNNKYHNREEAETEKS